MIEADNLRKAFGAVTAVKDVTLRAQDGRITGLLGPNGAGKSTTLRILYTVLRPDAGDARKHLVDHRQQPDVQLLDTVEPLDQALKCRRDQGTRH